MSSTPFLPEPYFLTCINGEKGKIGRNLSEQPGRNPDSGILTVGKWMFMRLHLPYKAGWRQG